MASHGNDAIVIELDDEGLRLCSVMGKKKYWKVIDNDDDDDEDRRSGARSSFDETLVRRNIVTKGFEKNAQLFIKHLVRTLQINVLRYIELFVVSSSSSSPTEGEKSFSAVVTTGDRAFRLIVEDVPEFFGSVFSSLQRYESRHGVTSFAFGVKLNPRATDGPEARFIQRTLTDYNFAIGDRAQALFVLDARDSRETHFKLARDFDESVDRVNYYKVLRRIAIYLLQTVEGFKRSDATNELHMNAATFDATLHSAYERWLAKPTEFGERYAGLLYREDCDSRNWRDNGDASDRRDRLLRRLVESRSLRVRIMSLLN